MMTELVALKWKGQYPKLKQVLTIFSNFFKQVSLDTRCFRCPQEIWLGPGDEDDEHLAIASLNSCLENVGQLMIFA